MLRVLVTVTPQVYRQAIALSLRRKRPGGEGKIASPEGSGGGACDLPSAPAGSQRQRRAPSGGPGERSVPHHRALQQRHGRAHRCRRRSLRSDRHIYGGPISGRGRGDRDGGAVEEARQPSRGTRIFTVVPWPGCEVTFSSPPIISARSRMDPRPRPDRWPVSEAASVSKPFPSSVTVPSSSSG